ncbi:hypothetical protein QQS21_012467 [Conoideocrella luteorostrata]|uniref:Prefoldin subunit 3 n=1 Tax=Conoideocrella luteorostrata TaxID=1105319 RepID=A0AAJ0FSN8_9HYPO|nr:hypothetical protein QQS21_012467 [Conoideocrella luteorostrata]
MTASHLLEKVLGGDSESQLWRERVAAFRSVRLPIILLQEIIRQDEIESKSQSEVLQLLPNPNEMDTILKHPALAGYSQEFLDHYIYVLRGHDDDERCRRYLEKPASTPLFIFNFLVRPSADIKDVGALPSIIESCHSYYDDVKLAKARPNELSPAGNLVSGKTLRISQANFRLIMRLLVRHCLRLEPRFVVKLADTASRYIQTIATYPDEQKKLYLTQCDVFNGCLQIFRPQPQLQAVQRSIPNVYFWEAQRILLSMSAGLQKPLLISRDGFRAIRDVLSGQQKNYTELRSSARHAPSWPPYLQAGHGMDESSDPEDNWSRTVSAGMLMQEAGFSKEEMDDAVDILQGMTLDGAPTIQQRSAIGKGRDIGIWEASIRATRNAQEAWERFRNPPEPAMKPGPEQYAAMFEKLVLREVELDSRVLPGDKALNFPTQHEANLAEFERARLRPPSISELYQHMRLAAVAPEGSCLRILVANAESLETAHQYLRDSPERSRVIRCLLADEPDPNLLRTMPLNLFAAYIQVCLRAEGRRGSNQLMRAVRLAEVKLNAVKSRWVPFIWGIILKGLSQHHKALGISLPEQLSLIMRVADTIETSGGVQLSTFSQFNKCVRKVARRELNKLFAVDAKSGGETGTSVLEALYCVPANSLSGHAIRGRHAVLECESTDEEASGAAATITLLQKACTRLKHAFWMLTEIESNAQEHLGAYHISSLERMNSRRDAVRSDHAHEYMLTLGFLGQFEEMGRLLSWLIEEWGHADVASALNELDEPPPNADFFETLCVFRLVAEPMLENSTMLLLTQEMADSRLDWTWPDDEAVKTYATLHDDEPIGTLRRVLELARDRNKAMQHKATSG